jgi:formylmethanofuran dehydrogenase subunit D
MPLTNAERQRRFRELTLKERQLKADAFDLLVAIIDCDVVENDEIPLSDGRLLKVSRKGGEVVVHIAANPKMQREIEMARHRLLHGDD